MKLKDKLLFTPGPLTTSLSTKEKMLTDLGSRDSEFINIVKSIRKDLLQLAGFGDGTNYDAVLMQGSGTFGVESVISTVVSENDHLLVIKNGAYGNRMEKIARIYKINLDVLEFNENEAPDVNTVDRFLQKRPYITHVAIVHCETTSGIFNDIHKIGHVVKKYKTTFIVDAMSSFGGVSIDFNTAGIDFLISSSNKCIEGVPGFSFVIFNTQELSKCEGQARSLSLDLYDQWIGLKRNGQFRFTPPIQVILAFKQALTELFIEGGVNARGVRYKRNHQILMKGMSDLGFVPYLNPDVQGYIITSFLYPDNTSFNAELFFDYLSRKGLVIYPGKLKGIECFRIGNIGHLFSEDVELLITTIKEAVKELNIQI